MLVMYLSYLPYLKDRLRHINEIGRMQTHVWSVSEQDVLIGDGDRFRGTFGLPDDDDGIGLSADSRTAGLCDDIREHESGSEIDDTGFLDLSIDGDGSFGNFPIDADDGGIAQIFCLQPFADNDFKLVAAFSFDADLTKHGE